MFQIVIGPRQALPQTLVDMYDPLPPRRELWLLTLCYSYWLCYTDIDFWASAFRKLLSICYTCCRFHATWQIGVVLFTYRPNTLQNYNSIYFEFQRVINMHPHKCRAKLLLIINSLGVCKNIEFIVLVFKNLHPSSNSMSRKPHLTWNIYI